MTRQKALADLLAARNVYIRRSLGLGPVTIDNGGTSYTIESDREGERQFTEIMEWIIATFDRPVDQTDYRLNVKIHSAVFIPRSDQERVLFQLMWSDLIL